MTQLQGSIGATFHSPKAFDEWRRREEELQREMRDSARSLAKLAVAMNRFSSTADAWADTLRRLNRAEYNRRLADRPRQSKPRRINGRLRRRSA